MRTVGTHHERVTERRANSFDGAAVAHEMSFIRTGKVDGCERLTVVLCRILELIKLLE